MGSNSSKQQTRRRRRDNGMGERSQSTNDLDEYNPYFYSPRDIKSGGRVFKSRNHHGDSRIKKWNSDFDLTRKQHMDDDSDDDSEYDNNFDAKSYTSYGSDDSGISSTDTISSGASSMRPDRYISSNPSGQKNKQRKRNDKYGQTTLELKKGNAKMQSAGRTKNHKRASPPSKQSAKSLMFSPKSSLTWSEKLPVYGQGTVFFNIVRNTPFAIVVRKPGSEDFIALDITKRGAFFTMKLNKKAEVIAATNDENAGIQPNVNVTYWVSYDRDNLTLRYGKGYMMEEAILLEHYFIEEHQSKSEVKAIRDKLKSLFNPKDKRVIELREIDEPEKLRSAYQRYIQALQETERKSSRNISMEKVLSPQGKTCMFKYPLIHNRPSFILDSEKVNLFQLDRGDYTFSASLPPAALVLFENVKNTELNWPEEVDGIVLSDAIRYSIETKGCLLYNKLKEKAKSGFGNKPNKKQTYLRITLGNSLGASPGIPYVLELWPAGHFSPIHNHGNSSAVIKVLFGSIHARIFNRISTDIYGKEEAPQLLKEFDAEQNDVTWMDRNWYQTHQLENITDDFCATIQCYNYDDKDTSHWPYFDYIDNNSNISEFLPNTDFTFLEMRDKVLEEYRSSIY